MISKYYISILPIQKGLKILCKYSRDTNGLEITTYLLCSSSVNINSLRCFVYSFQYRCSSLHNRSYSRSFSLIATSVDFSSDCKAVSSATIRCSSLFKSSNSFSKHEILGSLTSHSNLIIVKQINNIITSQVSNYIPFEILIIIIVLVLG